MKSNNHIQFDVLLKTVGYNLRVIRTARNETLEGVAEALNSTHSMLSNIENGNYNPLKLEMLIKICNYYQITLQQVMDLEMVQFFSFTQRIENGTIGNTLKQVGSADVVNDCTEGYKLHIDYLTKEIVRLREIVSSFHMNPDILPDRG